MKSRFSRLSGLVGALVVVFSIAAVAASGGGSPTEELRASDPSAEATATAAAAVVPMSTPVVYITNAFKFPDALAGGPAVAQHDGPILLVNQNSIPQATADELTRLDPAKIVVLGGTLSVSASVEAALAAYTSGPVERYSGGSRFETAVEISKANFPAPQITPVVDGTSSFETIETTCTDYPGLVLTIDTPVSGTVVINGRINILTSHVTGTDSEVDFGISTSPSTCAFDYEFDGFVFVPGTLPTDDYYNTEPIMHVADVGPGVHNFYVTGLEVSGAGSADFWWGGLNGVFYPNP